MEKEKLERFEGDVINVLFIVSFFIVIAGAFLRYYFLKEYSFTVETPCNPTFELCYERDCSNPDDCPPNGWNYYKQFKIPASEFDACEGDNCVSYCRESGKCTEIICDEDESSCSKPN